VAVALLPEGSEAVGVLTGLGFGGAALLLPLLIPLLAGAVALASTWAAARRRLGELG